MKKPPKKAVLKIVFGLVILVLILPIIGPPPGGPPDSNRPPPSLSSLIKDFSYEGFKLFVAQLFVPTPEKKVELVVSSVAPTIESGGLTEKEMNELLHDLSVPRTLEAYRRKRDLLQRVSQLPSDKIPTELREVAYKELLMGSTSSPESQDAELAKDDSVRMELVVLKIQSADCLHELMIKSARSVDEAREMSEKVRGSQKEPLLVSDFETQLYFYYPQLKSEVKAISE